jgi:hypothetical protein
MKYKSELMKRLRAERKAAGLVKIEFYVTTKAALKIKAFAATLK